VPLAAPYSQLASLDAEGAIVLYNLRLWLGGKTQIDMRRLPDLGQTSSILNFTLKLKIKFLVFNLLKTSMHIQKNAPGDLLPLDGVAGGTRNLGGVTLSSNLSNIPPASGFSSWFLFGYSYNYATPYIAPTFSFVPTTSALDVANFSAVNIPYSVPVTGLNGSRSENYIAQERITLAAPIGITNNVTHTDFYARTCNWLYNEMENITQTISCIDFCQPVEGSYQISGPEVVCTTGIYTISGLPLGTVFTWGVSGNGTIASISPNGLSATVTRIGSGLVNVIATIPAVANCIPQQEVTKAVKVGPPSAGTLFAQYSSGVNAGILLKQVNCMEPYLPGSFQANINWYDYVGTNFSWLLVSKSAGSTANFQMGPGNQSATITLRPQNAYATYRLTVTNACGSYQKSYKFNASSTDCPDIVEVPFLVSPNPTSSRVTLDLKGTEIVSIRIKDKFGNVVKAIKEVKMASRVEVNLSQLKTDIYIVEVFDGKTWFVKKVIKQ